MRAFWRLGSRSLKRWLQVVTCIVFLQSCHLDTTWNTEKLMKYFLCSAVCLLIDRHMSNQSRKHKEQQPSSKPADFWGCAEKWSLKQNPHNFDPQQTWRIPRRTERTKVQRRVDEVHRSSRGDRDPVSAFFFIIFFLIFYFSQEVHWRSLEVVGSLKWQRNLHFQNNCKKQGFYAAGFCSNDKCHHWVSQKHREQCWRNYMRASRRNIVFIVLCTKLNHHPKIYI